MLKAKILNNVILDWQKVLRIFKYFEKVNPVLDSFPKSTKIAFVKQYVYADLYSKTFVNHLDPDEIINSSNHRSGPIGLFKYFNADFYIVDVDESDNECNVYKEKGENKKWIEISSEQKKHSVDSNTINWSKYDLVICLENAVPFEIIKKHKEKTIWATMLETHTMPSYRKYLKKPPKGYDFFLNQQFGPNPINIFKRKHVLDWSYSLNLTSNQEFKKSKSILIETHATNEDLKFIESLSGFEFYYSDQNRTMSEYLEMLAASKYLILPTSKSEKILTGNITIEAAANRVLILGNKNFIWNPFIINDKCHVKSLTKLKTLIETIENDKSLYNSLLDEQSKRLDYYGFSRPLNQLTKRKDFVLK